jgi:hypothetical protein
MNTTIENMFETELTKVYQNGYNDGYNHGLSSIYSPKSEDADYMDGYSDGQTDASELE